MPAAPSQPVPVTVIAGFLGTGKSTLLEAALRNRGNVGGRLCVIVNDVADLNVDAALLRGAKVVRADDDVVELSDGCMCCNLGASLLDSVYKACAGANPPAAVVVECSGVAETAGMAELFRGAEAANDPVCRLARLASIVTVVDSEAFPRMVRSKDAVAERDDLGGEVAEDSCRGVADLLLEQVETADVVVLNKADTVGEAELDGLRGVVGAINPAAEVIAAKYGDVPLRVVLPSNADAPSARESRALARHSGKKKRGREEPCASPAGAPEVAGEARYTKRFQIKSLVFRSHKAPFHPQRIEALLEAMAAFMGADPLEAGQSAPRTRYGPLRNVLRAKGTIWLTDAPKNAVRLAAAGSRIEMHAGGEWSAKTPAGKARQELVVIGQGLDVEAVRELLEGALLTDKEYAEFQADPDVFEKRASALDSYWCKHQH